MSGLPWATGKGAGNFCLGGSEKGQEGDNGKDVQHRHCIFTGAMKVLSRVLFW